MSQDYFQILEVPQNASSEDIKRAYFKMVRKYPPEKEPELFKLVRQAYDTLSDPQARGDYLDMLHHGGEIMQLYEEATDHMDKKSYPLAIRSLKKILALAPGEHGAGNMLGLCHLEMDEFSNAINVYESLTKKAPDVPLYWFNYGAAYHGQAKKLSDSDRNRSRMLEEARSKYEKSIDLESRNQIPYQAIADTYMDEKNYAQAENWIEKAIGADNKVDIDDLDSMFKLCLIYILSDRIQRVGEIARRIMSFIPEDPDVRLYVSHRFIEYARIMCEKELFHDGLEFIKAALRFDPSNSDLKKWSGSVQSVVDVSDQYAALKTDHTVIEPLHRLISLYLCDFWGQSKDIEHQRDAIFKDIMNHFDQFTHQQILSSITRLKSKYPALHHLNSKFLNEIEEFVRQASRDPQPKPTPQPEPGGCFIATATFGTPDAPIVVQYRNFRDTILIHYPVGRALIRIYQRVGPIGAWILNRIPRLKKPSALILKLGATLIPKS